MALEFEARDFHPRGMQIRDLHVIYQTNQGEIPAVNGVSMAIAPGKITGIIGESGSGKSTLAMALMNAVPKPGRIVKGSVVVDGAGDMLTIDKKIRQKVRGRDIGFVFQASQNSLNPLIRVGKQVLDLGRSHNIKDLRALLRRAKELLERMGMDAERILLSYQHELSGGMRQRVGIMLALVLEAQVVILDEPTTALDMISQASVLEIVRQIHQERHLTTILISHDMGVVADLADNVVVMYGGELAEAGSTEEILAHPLHPYTQGLIRAIPRISGPLEQAIALSGSPPDVAALKVPGCLFASRCPKRLPKCENSRPIYEAIGSDRYVACFRGTEHD